MASLFNRERTAAEHCSDIPVAHFVANRSTQNKTCGERVVDTPYLSPTMTARVTNSLVDLRSGSTGLPGGSVPVKPRRAVIRVSWELNEVVERLLQRFPDVQEERVRSVVTNAYETSSATRSATSYRSLSSAFAGVGLGRSVPVAPANG